MRLCFDSVDELKEFVKSLKGTRGGKNSGDENEGSAAGGNAPAPLMPPQQPGAMSFAAPQQPAATFSPPGGFTPGGTAPTVDPAVAAIVARIVTRIDGAINAGQPADQVLGWFRGECAKGGQDATNATLDQIKQVLLAKLPTPQLDSIAKLMNA